MKDRRTARRYDLSLPVIVGPPTGNETASRTGNTRDISAQGVYFTINRDLDTDGILNFKMTLPSEATDGSEVFIKATGRIIRVDKRSGIDDEKVGVAAVFEMQEIVRRKTEIA
jgi:hypothetical protein